MRAVVRATMAGLAVAAALGGCGGGKASGGRAAAPAPAATPDASDVNRTERAPALVTMMRVGGDDPLPFTVTVHDDRTAAVRWGGGHGGWTDKVIRLSAGEAARVARRARAAPFARLDGHTVEPGGFGGDDNGNRYMLRRAGRSVTVAAGDMPAAMHRLVRLLDGIIDGDVGSVAATDSHNPTSATATTG